MKSNLKLFFIITFAISWSIWGIGLLFPSELGFAFFPIGVLGPAIAAMIISYRNKNLKQLLSTLKPHKIPLLGLILMLVTAPLAMTIPLLFFPAIGDKIPLSFIFELVPIPFNPWFVIPLLPIIFPLLMIGNLGEEIGWRGFAIEKLGKNYGYLLGSIILGAINAIWHAPLYWLIGNPIYNPLGLMFYGFLLFEIGLYNFLHNHVFEKQKEHLCWSGGSHFCYGWVIVSPYVGTPCPNMDIWDFDDNIFTFILLSHIQIGNN